MLADYSELSDQYLLYQKIIYSKKNELEDVSIENFLQEISIEASLNTKALDLILNEKQLGKSVKLIKGRKIEDQLYASGTKRLSLDIDIVTRDEASFAIVCGLLDGAGYEESFAIDLQLKDPKRTFSTRFVPKGSHSDRGFELHCMRFPIDLHGRSISWEEMDVFEQAAGTCALQVFFLLTQFDRKNRCLVRDAVELELLLKKMNTDQIDQVRSLAVSKKIELPKVVFDLIPSANPLFIDLSEGSERKKLPIFERLRKVIDRINESTIIGSFAIGILDSRMMVSLLRKIDFPLVVSSSKYCKDNKHKSLSFAKRKYFYSTTGSNFEPIE